MPKNLRTRFSQIEIFKKCLFQNTLVNILTKFQLSSSYGLGRTVSARFWTKGWPTHLINYGGVCRTAPATPGLLNRGQIKDIVKGNREQSQFVNEQRFKGPAIPKHWNTK